MEMNLDPSKDDLPLRANTNHMLVRHYVLDLAVHFERKVISGNVVLFFETGKGGHKLCNTEASEPLPQRHSPHSGVETPDRSQFPLKGVSAYSASSDTTDAGGSDGKDTLGENSCHGDSQLTSLSSTKQDCSEREDFVLVLDCCDLSVSKVEEVDVTSVRGVQELRSGCVEEDLAHGVTDCLRSHSVQKLVTLPAECWEEQHDLYMQCSQAPGCGDLSFETDSWSLQIRKEGIHSPCDFPHALRIYYETMPEGASVRWTKDQSGRACVYTVGSPINNRALFPCQEPPVAMSTWQAAIEAPPECVVLLSGEKEAQPARHKEVSSQWFYYVTMPMPASTFTIAVGHWIKAERKEASTADRETVPIPAEACSLTETPCHHVDYPCRFQRREAQVQAVIPHRVFAPACLREQAEDVLLPLLPSCLSAAHSVLGAHPFPRLDVLIVPTGFSSLGMASPHIMFLSQSVLSGKNNLCGARLCHEIAHAWFGLAIGAQDWTEEWISEGFATYLEDVFWARAQQLSQKEAQELCQLKALLRWRRLRDELQNSEEELQILRPNRERTGEVSDSGTSLVKHALNPGKVFMQVHYLKGYFLLQFLASKIGEDLFLQFFCHFVHEFHGQLILSQDFLHRLLENFPEIKRQGLTLEAIYQDWLDSAGIPKPLFEGSNAWLHNNLVQAVKEEVAKWTRFSQSHRKGSKRKRGEGKVIFKEIAPEQLVLLLELLLEEPDLSVGTLRSLVQSYGLQTQDAEVRHRWCELVIKHKHTEAYGHVGHFLKQDQGRCEAASQGEPQRAAHWISLQSFTGAHTSRAELL
ncbi:aminopeptidase O isoform X2 [Amia ocellicauda]|uniref:aminopeptidase O isoform X2 n=1 Tax=Amia ocellicauda TaxID=2972642 RepID=UPI0034640450